MKSFFLWGILLLGTFLMQLKAQEHQWKENKVPTNDALHDIEWASERVGYAYTYGTGKILKTVDKGDTWQVVSQLDSVYFEQIHFFNEQVGWICGNDNKVLKTMDGGNTWSSYEIDPDSTGIAFYGMAFRDRQHGYLAQIVPQKDKTLHTVIYRTTNEGESWQKVHTIPEMILNLEWYAKTLWGSGNNVIIKNIDRQKGWNYHYRDSTGRIGQIRDLSFDHNYNIKAVSFNGFVLTFTADQKWSSQRITKNRLRSVVKAGERTWIAAGDSLKEPGHIFIKREGTSWQQISPQLPDVHRLIAHQNAIWAVGKEGIILNRRVK